MNKSLLAALNDAERLLVAETEAAALALLDEDATDELHTRVRRARNKYTGQYRRAASARVKSVGGRGQARPKNTAAALKAEAFEEALSRVSRRLGVLARRSAADLRHERLEAARAAKSGARPAPAKAAAATGRKTAVRQPAARTTGAGRPLRTVTAAPAGDRALRSPATEKNRAGTLATGARRQAKRDTR
jgi:hypothetical protein